MSEANTKIDRNRVLQALQKVEDPELHRSIVDLGMVGEVREKNGTVKVTIKLTIPGCPLKHKINEDVTAALKEIDGVKSVDIDFTTMKPQERANLTKKMTGQAESQLFDSAKVKNVIAIASGKGGVGKSTVTVNLAYALKNAGFKVGIVDSDVYGFSIPRMMGINEPPTVIDNTLIPVEKNGIKLISMGFFIEEDQAVLWRGPMLHKTINQFLTTVYWDELDYLLIDLPPGTGDVTLTISQTVQNANLIVVTTPQPAAAGVAQRVYELCKKANYNMLGVVENMSYFEAPDGSRQHIFGEGGGKALSQKLDQPLLGQVPLLTAIREGGDNGKPIAMGDNGAVVEEFNRIAENLVKQTAKSAK